MTTTTKDRTADRQRSAQTNARIRRAAAAAGLSQTEYLRQHGWSKTTAEQIIAGSEASA